MLFNSIEFILFLPIVFLLYWFLFETRKIQNMFILFASYVFYGWWDKRFLLLIAITSFCSYYSGILIEHYEGKRKKQKLVSACNIILNLLILGVFKYYNFFVDNLQVIMREAFSMNIDWPTLKIILPVGISFYTFQALSYTIDVYRKNISATHDLVEFFAYISFFPQLVAGPIERATNLLPQFQHTRSFNYDKAIDGCRQMLWGFFKKLVIADTCSIGVNHIWNAYQDQSGIMLFVGGLLFTFQIYGDFSGYSDIAIGCARLFGFNLKRNFHFPYFSRDISEFWRRWHISLMTWFRDYIYFPLGGSRCARWKATRNTIVVFFISGLWHGANWTFVTWGLYNACLLVILSFIGKNKYKVDVANERWLPSVKEGIQMITTFLFVVIGWIVFRAENVGQAYHYLSNMFTHSWIDHNISLYIAQIGLALIMLVAEWIQRDKQHALQISNQGLLQSTVLRRGLYVILTLCCMYCFFSNNKSEFIYFQF